MCAKYQRNNEELNCHLFLKQDNKFNEAKSIIFFGKNTSYNSLNQPKEIRGGKDGIRMQDEVPFLAQWAPAVNQLPLTCYCKSGSATCYTWDLLYP